ncbi:nuclear transport factor 2 family protein [Aurantimonas sp. Leaf443]|uniref:YybH family protein n=1 Tax=Aurantimonas sp. Leaf443 TaxID=1736378 RepID=UPI0009EA77D8|nr:nuclear transport factor 2 family protein [Aurantimonas sp. Leaf443]
MIKRILILALAAAAYVTPVTARDASGEVTQAYANWDAAFNARDAAALSATYTENALFLAPDHVVRRGPDEVRRFFGGLFDHGVTDHKLTLIETETAGEIVYATASWSARAKGADGAPAAIGGVGTHIFERQPDGTLKLRLHTFN